jgi:hypothetical protein
VAADPGDIAICISFGESAPRLVAVGAQVAFAAIEGRSFDRVERYRIGGLQSEVSRSIGGVDLVTGPAILAGWMRVAGLDLAWILSRCNHGAETSTGVAAGAVCAGCAHIGFAGSV